MAIDKDKTDEIVSNSEPEKEEEVKETETLAQTDSEEEEEKEETEENAVQDADSEEDEEEESEDDESEEEEEEKSDSKSKAKKDHVPAIMVALIYLVIVAVALYYILPPVFAPSFGYTLEEFNAKLSASDIEKTMNRSYNSLVPMFKVVDKNSIKDIWGVKGEIEADEQKKIDKRFKPFVNTLAATEELGTILVEANTRKNDGQLTRMCIYCVYSNENMNMMMIHFGAILQNFIGDGITINEAIFLILRTQSDNLYSVRGDIAYRVSMDNIGGKQAYIKLEVIPAKALKPEQIEQTDATTATAAQPSGTTAAPAS
jgi:hypothetical protein